MYLLKEMIKLPIDKCMDNISENSAHAVSDAEYMAADLQPQQRAEHFASSSSSSLWTVITFFCLVYIMSMMNHLNTRKEWETTYESWSLK